MACTNNESTNSLDNDVMEEDVTENVVRDNNEDVLETEDVEMFEEAISQGVLTIEEATMLMTYMTANDPKNVGTEIQSAEMVSPLIGAAEEGIITFEQATMLETIIEIPDMEMGNNQGGPGVSGDMISIEDANAFEEKLLAAVGYTAAVGGYPIVDTN